MGRPRLYHTAEQKVAANRAKSKRHYNKVKHNLLIKRQNTRAQSQSVATLDTPTRPAGPNQDTTLSEVDRAVSTWIERSLRIQSRLHSRADGSLTVYLERLYSKYIQDHDRTSINEELSALHLLRDAIYRYEDKVLSLVGITDAYQQVKDISTEVVNAVNWVDELYVYTHLGMDEFQQTHNDREFMYQAN